MWASIEVEPPFLFLSEEKKKKKKRHTKKLGEQIREISYRQQARKKSREPKKNMYFPLARLCVWVCVYSQDLNSDAHKYIIE
jgi:hypothetical protein